MTPVILGPFDLGDALVGSGQPREALDAYREASSSAGSLPELDRVWLNLAIANAGHERLQTRAARPGARGA